MDNDTAIVRFWMDAYPNAAKSAEAGRQIFDTVPWCEYKTPGERDNIRGPVHKIAEPGSPKDPRVRFAAAWDKWQKDNSSEGIVGTPLSEVPWLARGEVETLKASGLRTLENLAALNDANVTSFPGGLALRQKARDSLKAAQDAAPLNQMSEELAKRDAQIADLQKQLADLIADRRRTKVKE